MTSQEQSRSIQLEVEVRGAPEDVWRAIATGPGISSWFVPADVEERPGGRVALHFGGTADEGTVTAWEPPHRFTYAGAASRGRTLAFEWLVEGRDGGTCVVRLVNSGFGLDADWDADFDGMSRGWPIFLANLRLHLAYFAGRTAEAVLPMGVAPGPNRAAWEALCGGLGVSPLPSVGGRFETNGDGVPLLSGTVEGAVERPATRACTLLLDKPVPGTGFIAAEGDGEHVGLSVWLYLYGDGAAQQAEVWNAWMAQYFPAPG